MLHQTTFLTIYILTITFILGCALGSFADCLAGRMLAGTSILKGRSHCDACGHVLGVSDLVPLFSWLCL
uniref:prepilin peptidase n=1 Tax=Clostridium sp. TaxID=1506 RepID=UPI0030772CAB